MNDFGGKPMAAFMSALVALMISLIGLLLYTAVSNQHKEDLYMAKCIAAGGVFIDGHNMDFCVKEFMPMEDK